MANCLTEIPHTHCMFSRRTSSSSPRCIPERRGSEVRSGVGLHRGSLLRLCVAAFATQVSRSSARDLHDLPAVKSGQQPTGFIDSVEGWHQGPIYALAFGEHGLIATGATDKTVAVWNLTAGQGRKLFGDRPQKKLQAHKGGVTALAFARAENGDELLLSGSADNSTRVWNAWSGKALSTLPHPKTVFGLSVQTKERRTGSRVASACWDGIIRLFDFTQPTVAPTTSSLVGHEGGLYGVAFSPLDGSLLASASADKTVRVWDVTKMKLLWTLRSHSDHVTTVDWSPTQPYVLASGGWDRKFRLWSLNDPAELEACRSQGRCSADVKPKVTQRHPQLVWRVAFAPAGDLVAACHGAVGQSPTVVIYSVSTGRVVRRLGRHKDTPLTIAWSPDGAMLASAGMDRKLLVYEADSPFDDFPHHDADDAEEQFLWREDLEELRTWRRNRSLTRAEMDAENETQKAIDRMTYAYPVQGRAAYF
eukprot:TRINITY_DN92047_c0_g1_i1.p1 TRINITY_DN92047_c0_g1~~TRINITY_DN92047_c0_g1_i1.p1  ORF type:complete len:477 (-),score=25.28 TRINITY_DN92047_c0_g1_i1:111-1541(-)